MIVVGALLAAWGALVLYLGRRTRRDDPWVRRAGVIVLVAGLFISLVGAIVLAVESM